ncbi:MAG: ankyrin repeat domain-containing protein [Gammaproteobacteria bacterium]|nr:ankyrin repeat domain-containing protein [Gammaproteobacteria bacterium]MCP5424852.1 ankyrin repeat domain-containing protein [Gammaproteobacteria bacterium]MCP5458171.1 ankyrin repeat domain-containing protein [Gammaproteobacteria bacterium]
MTYTLDTVREAIQRGDAEYVQKALESGFDPNVQDSKLCTPLIFAAEFQNPAIVRLLLAHGADPLHKDSGGYNASDVAAFSGEWRMGAYTDESVEIQAILKAHIDSPNVGLFAWLKRVFLTS